MSSKKNKKIVEEESDTDLEKIDKKKKNKKVIKEESDTDSDKIEKKKKSQQSLKKNKKKVKKNKLKMIDLCAGTGAFTYAFESTNKVKVVFANDIEKSSKIIYEENFDHELTLGDICEIDVEDIPSHDILTAGFPCFISGTKVLSHEGYKNIEDITVDDKLLTHTGIFQNILNLQQKTYTGDIYEIKLKYHADLIKCTDEHPFYVRERKKVRSVDTKKYEYVFSEPEWKPANEISQNDFFGMIINNEEIIPEFTFNKNINDTTYEVINIKLDKSEQWFMIGYFVGYGWIEETKKTNGNCAYKIRFAINNKDEIYVLSKITKVLPITDKKCDTGKCKKFGCVDFVWYNILKQFGKYTHREKIPEWIQSAPKKFIKDFIDGYVTANGYMNKNEVVQITTVSYDLAYGLQRLYLKLGHIFSINRCKRSKTCVIQGRTVNQRDTFCVRGKINKERVQSAFIEENYAWFPSFEINKETVEEIEVYNFEVENDNSYIVENIIVHNCQPFSISGKQKGFDDPRSNVFWKILEIAKYHKPQCIILENVKNLVSHDNGDTFKIIKNSLKKENYHIIYKILNTSEITHIPQHRERIYIVCVKDKNIFDNFDLAFKNVKKKKISTMLTNDDVNDKYYYNDDENKIHEIVMDSVTEKEKVYQFRRIYVRENKNNECPTLTAIMGTGGHNVPLILDDIGARKLTPRECFNFQGFPEEYILPELSDSKLYKLAGNAVSFPVVKLIADKIVPKLFDLIIDKN